MLLLGLLTIAAWAIHDRPPAVVSNAVSGLRTWEVGNGRLPLVLLHGYASTPDGWLPFTSTIRVPATRRFIFPEAPQTTAPPDGPVMGRAWWHLDLASYIPRGQALPDLLSARPDGLGRSTARVEILLKEIERRLGSSPDRMLLGGFSQGAMIAADLAFRTGRPLEALVLLSGTFVDEARWTAGMRARRGLPVFIAHGRRDDILSFAIAQRLARTMREAGLRVTWYAFEDGHDTPAEVVDALNRFLAALEPSER